MQTYKIYYDCKSLGLVYSYVDATSESNALKWLKRRLSDKIIQIVSIAPTFNGYEKD